MIEVAYETADGTDTYRADDYHTDREQMLVALRYSNDGVDEKRSFPLDRVIYVEA